MPTLPTTGGTHEVKNGKSRQVRKPTEVPARPGRVPLTDERHPRYEGPREDAKAPKATKPAGKSPAGEKE